MPPLTIENDWKLNSFSRIIEAASDRDALRTVFGIDQEVDAFVRRSLKGELEDILCCGAGRQTFVPNGQHPSEWVIDGEPERC